MHFSSLISQKPIYVSTIQMYEKETKNNKQKSNKYDVFAFEKSKNH